MHIKAIIKCWHTQRSVVQQHQVWSPGKVLVIGNLSSTCQFKVLPKALVIRDPPIMLV